MPWRLICDGHISTCRHLNTEHTLDDRSTAQARVQMQVVSQLELQLQKERDRLQAMMHHLHLSKQLGSPEPHKDSAVSSGKLPVSATLPQPPVSIGPMVSSVRSPVLHATAPNVAGPIRRRLSDKSALSLAGGKFFMLRSHFINNVVILVNLLTITYYIYIYINKRAKTFFLHATRLTVYARKGWARCSTRYNSSLVKIMLFCIHILTTNVK